MEHREKKMVEQDVLVRTTCDFCGATEGKSERWPPRKPYGRDDEIRIEHNITLSSYPEGGHGKELEVDCCPACWNEKVLPALRNLGLKREYRDWDI